MCFVASFVATVQRVVSAIKNPWFLEAKAKQRCQESILVKNAPLLPSPAVSLSVPGAPSSLFYLLANLHGAL